MWAGHNVGLSRDNPSRKNKLYGNIISLMQTAKQRDHNKVT